MAKIKVGVIGVGSMGENHVRIYKSLSKDFSLIGVFEPNIERANEIAVKYGTTAFATLEELLPNIEALSLVSPTSLHAQIAKVCLGQKKHLLVEKPLAGTYKDAEEVVNIAEQNQCTLAVGMIERFNPAFAKALTLLKGEKILGATFKRFSPYPQRISDASVVFDMMLHDIDLAIALSSSPVSSVKASGKKVCSKLLDEAAATLYFQDGLIVKIEASRVKDDKKRHITVTTDKYLYEIDLLKKSLYRRSFDCLTDKEDIDVAQDDQLTSEFKDFYSAITKKREPKVSGRTSLLSLHIAEEVEKTKC